MPPGMFFPLHCWSPLSITGSTGANGKLRRFQDPVQTDAIHQQVRLYHQQEGCGRPGFTSSTTSSPNLEPSTSTSVFNIKTKTGKEADGFSLHWGQPRFTIERDSGQNNLHKV